MKVLKIVLLTLCVLLIVVVSFTIFAMAASSHNIPKSTFFWAFSWLTTLFLIYFLISYFFKNRDLKIKHQLHYLSKSIPEFQNSKEHEWFIEYYDNFEWGLAFDTIEDFISESEITLNQDLTLKFHKLKNKLRFS